MRRRGNKGQRGRQGAGGAQGAAGPAGAAAIQAGVVSLPNPRDAILRYPPSGTLGADHKLFRMAVVVHKRDALGAKTNAFRKGRFDVDYYGELGASVGNVSLEQAGTWKNSVAPLTAFGAGTTSVSLALINVSPGEFYVEITCSGPNAAQAPNGCSWAVSLADLGSLTAPV